MKIMKKNIIILTLSLVLVLMFSIVVGCGDSSPVSSEATKEETKALESTTAIGESTALEATKVGEKVAYMKGMLDYSKCTISEETKAMLIEKLTNLELEKDEKFDVYSLPFKENELQACYELEAELAFFMNSSIGHNGVLKCKVSKFKIAKVVGADARVCALAGLLHDFYTDKDLKGNSSVKRLGLHPNMALENSIKYYKLDDIQKDIIKTHMFPCNFDIPKYKESWLVSGVDKLVSTYEMLRYKASLYMGIYALFLFEMIKLPR